MHDAHHFLVNLALVLCVAAVTTVIFQRLRQPVVLGYLLAGTIVSPHTPFPLFVDEATVHTLSELGVILLMFSLGLDFSLQKLIRVAPTAGFVGVLQCSLLIWLGYSAGGLFGWSNIESLYAGAMIAISSTTIIAKVFEEQNVRGRLAEIVFGVLIVEDLIAIFLIAILTTISTGEPLAVRSVATTAGKLAAFLAFVVGGGLLIVPRLMRAIVRLGRPETTVVASVGLSFAFALIADAVGYSVALGAFLGGALVAESGESEVVERLVQPVRDIFAAVFFVAVGMMIDPVLVAEHGGAILVLTLVVVAGNLAAVSTGVFLTGERIRTAIQAGMSLAQIGEFSFIIAGVGVASGAVGAFLYPVAVAVSALTTLLTPWLIRASDPVAKAIDRRLPKPVQTFASLYGTWVEQIRSRPREPTVGRRIRRLVRLLSFDTALLAGIIIATAVWIPSASQWIGAQTALPDPVAWLAVLALAIVLASPFLVGIGRCTVALARLLGSIALPAPEKGTDLADAPRRVLVITLEMALFLFIGVPLAAVTMPFLAAFPMATALAAVIAVLALAFWRSTANLQAHARAGAQAIVEVLARQLHSAPSAPGAEARDLEQLHRVLPGLGAPRLVRLSPGSQAVGKSLAELNLRGLTGATVLAIVRDEDQLLQPTGRETLLTGDLLAVAGTTDAVLAADQLLTREGDGTIAM